MLLPLYQAIFYKLFSYMQPARIRADGVACIRKSLEGGLSRKAERKTKVCFDHLFLEKGIRKKPIIGLITGFFGGGELGIRTLETFRSTAFRVFYATVTGVSGLGSFL